MKRIVPLITLLFTVFFATACGTTSASNAHSSKLITGSFDQVHVPYYTEYEPIQIVFATTEEFETIDTPFLTYLALMKKASELGAHGIVNVAIEESRNCTKLTRDTPPYKENDTACRVKRFGTALAVKYTKIVVNGPLVENPQPKDDESQANESSSSKLLPF